MRLMFLPYSFENKTHVLVEIHVFIEIHVFVETHGSASLQDVCTFLLDIFIFDGEIHSVRKKTNALNINRSQTVFIPFLYTRGDIPGSKYFARTGLADEFCVEEIYGLIAGLFFGNGYDVTCVNVVPDSDGLTCSGTEEVRPSL